jgi:hypothetical protein
MCLTKVDKRIKLIGNKSAKLESDHEQVHFESYILTVLRCHHEGPTHDYLPPSETNNISEETRIVLFQKAQNTQGGYLLLD